MNAFEAGRWTASIIVIVGICTVWMLIARVTLFLFKSAPGEGTYYVCIVLAWLAAIAAMKGSGGFDIPAVLTAGAITIGCYRAATRPNSDSRAA